MDVGGDGTWSELVAKSFKFALGDRVSSTRDWYYREVESQVVAARLAEEFNARKPPKTVAFILPSVIELVHREGRPLCKNTIFFGFFYFLCFTRARGTVNVEPLLEGNYEKHNDNAGGVYQSTTLPFQRNTPQAFSHFSWVSSGQRCCVCDIQGVGDLYTDPQVHTPDGHSKQDFSFASKVFQI